MSQDFQKHYEASKLFIIALSVFTFTENALHSVKLSVTFIFQNSTGWVILLKTTIHPQKEQFHRASKSFLILGNWKEYCRDADHLHNCLIHSAKFTGSNLSFNWNFSMPVTWDFQQDAITHLIMSTHVKFATSCCR